MAGGRTVISVSSGNKRSTVSNGNLYSKRSNRLGLSVNEDKNMDQLKENFHNTNGNGNGKNLIAMSKKRKQQLINTNNNHDNSDGNGNVVDNDNYNDDDDMKRRRKGRSLVVNRSIDSTLKESNEPDFLNDNDDINNDVIDEDNNVEIVNTTERGNLSKRINKILLQESSSENEDNDDQEDNHHHHNNNNLKLNKSPLYYSNEIRNSNKIQQHQHQDHIRGMNYRYDDNNNNNNSNSNNNEIYVQELEELKYAYNNLRKNYEKLELSATKEASEKFMEYKKATDKRIEVYEEYNNAMKETFNHLKSTNKNYTIEMKATEEHIEKLEKTNEKLINTINGLKEQDLNQNEEIKSLNLNIENQKIMIDKNENIIQQLNEKIISIEKSNQEERMNLINKIDILIEQHAKDELKWIRNNVENGNNEINNNSTNTVEEASKSMNYQRTLNKMIRFYEALTGMTIESIQRELQIDPINKTQNKILVFRCSHKTEKCGSFEYKLGVGEDGIYTYQPVVESLEPIKSNEDSEEKEEKEQELSVIDKILNNFIQRKKQEHIMDKNHEPTEEEILGPLWLKESVEFEEIDKFFWRLLDYLQDA